MKASIAACICLCFCACGLVKGEPTVPGSPLKTEPKVENYKIESHVDNNVGLKTGRTMYLREPWRRVGLVAIGSEQNPDSALLEILSASLEKALPFVEFIALPPYSQFDESIRTTPIDAILFIEVTDTSWTVNDEGEQNLSFRVNLDCPGYPFDNVMYGGMPSSGDTEPSGEFDYRGKVDGSIRSDRLLEKAAAEVGKKIGDWAGEWFKDNCPKEPHTIAGSEHRSEVVAASSPIVADFLTPLRLPEDAVIVASGESTQPSLNQFAWMVIEMNGNVESVTRAMERAVDGWLVFDADYGIGDRWIRRPEDRFESTFVEPDAHYNPVGAIPKPLVAVRFRVLDLNEIPGPIGPDRIRIQISATRMRTSEELAELGRRQLERPASELDALLAYRLHPWHRYDDLTRQLYERAVRALPNQYMVHRAQAEFLAYRVKDASGAETAFDDAIRLLSGYELKDYAKELETLEESKRKALEQIP